LDVETFAGTDASFVGNWRHIAGLVFLREIRLDRSQTILIIIRFIGTIVPFSTSSLLWNTESSSGCMAGTINRYSSNSTLSPLGMGWKNGDIDLKS